jgi:NDP-sugar pyrophosphorylase family protein
VGSKPILETILESFVAQGFRRFNISVNYKAQMIEDYFGDGSGWGAEIRYVREAQRLGTAGALSLLEPQPDAPVLVMNGDLLTKVNFRQMLEFHRIHRQKASVAVRNYDIRVPFGVVEMRGNSLTRIVEKPEYNYFVNAGIYVLNPECLSLIPYNQFYDMPDLLTAILEKDWRVGSFPFTNTGSISAAWTTSRRPTSPTPRSSSDL